MIFFSVLLGTIFARWTKRNQIQIEEVPAIEQAIIDGWNLGSTGGSFGGTGSSGSW